MSASKQDYLSRKEAAAHLSQRGYPIAPATLARLAGKKRGPPYIRFLGRIVRYEKPALERWAAAQTERVE